MNAFKKVVLAREDLAGARGNVFSRRIALACAGNRRQRIANRGVLGIAAGAPGMHYLLNTGYI
jgi:hypothetical protein